MADRGARPRGSTASRHWTLCVNQKTKAQNSRRDARQSAASARPALGRGTGLPAEATVVGARGSRGSASRRFVSKLGSCWASLISPSALRQVLLALLDVEFLKSTLQDQHGFADFSVASVKRLIDRFIGASAIRINDQGRDKLFDIIWMVTKFQLANLTFGHEWLAVLENHLDNALVICANGPPSTDQILLERMQMVDQIVLGHFRKLSVWEMDQCKYSIWTYMLQKQARVSLLVQGLYQDPDSGQLRFTFKQHQLPPGFMAPGQIQ